MEKNIMTIKVQIMQLSHGKNLSLPFYATAESAGMDLSAAIQEEIILNPTNRILIPCGFSMAMPKGLEAQVRSRSGLALKNGVIVVNSPGTIDSDYRGEVKVILGNMGSEPFIITPGMRIAQLVIAPVSQIQWDKVDALSAAESDRHSEGFGSTGLF
jgi:dUTP pyrophosphatase